MKKDVPCISQGNDFKIAIVLKEKIKTDGEVSERDINILNNQVNVAVIKPNGDVVDNTQNVYSYALNGSTVIISFDKQGKSETGLPKGKYGIEVTGKRSEDSSDFCFSLPIGLAFEIVAYSTQGRFPSDSIITYTVDGVVGVAQNVSSGGGGGSGEANVIETIKVNGTALQVSNKAVDIPVPDELKDLGDDSAHRTVTDAEKQAWNNKSDFSGDYEDLDNKPTIPSKTSDLTDDIGFLTAHQDISGKEDKLTIETALAANSTAEFGKYYRLSLSSATTINLPAVTGNETALKGFLIYLTINTGGSIDWNANNNETIMASGLSSIAEGKTYEVNAAWNGAVWAITANEFTAYGTT